MNYIDNETLTTSILAYQKRYRAVVGDLRPKQIVAQGVKLPPMPRDIQKAILDVSKNALNMKSNGKLPFSSYSGIWKEEMRAKAVEHCLLYAVRNYDAYNGTPLNYLTKICRNAYIQAIKKLKRMDEADTLAYNKLYLHKYGENTCNL